MNWDLLSLLKQLVTDNRLAISNEELEDSLGQLPHLSKKQRSVYTLIGKIIQSSGNAAIGLSVGRLINPNSFHGLGYLFMTAENLQIACQRVSEFPAFYHHLVKLNTRIVDQQMVFQVDNEATDPLTRAVINEATLGIIYQYTNWLSQEVIRTCDVQLNHNPISPDTTYEKYFHRQPNFNSTFNQLAFPLSTAKAALLTSEPEYHSALYSKLKEKHDRMSQSFLARAQLAIRDGLKLGNVSRYGVANRLNLSEKTLERRLNQCNFSYRKLIDSIRLELAQKYLAQTQYSIDDIARNLGYCDRSTFSKAYKKWTGMTPGLHRQMSQRQ